jgi:hypothetical protein
LGTVRLVSFLFLRDHELIRYIGNEHTCSGDVIDYYRNAIRMSPYVWHSLLIPARARYNSPEYVHFLDASFVGVLRIVPPNCGSRLHDF